MMTSLLALVGCLAVAAAQEHAGHLTVCAVQAESLENLDTDEWFGGSASDPYVTLQVGSESCSSVVLKDKSAAVWNHCCSFGQVLVSEPIHVVVTDMDDYGDDDLIGLACTSVHSGTRWLDLIRHDTVGIVGSVQLTVIFEMEGGPPRLREVSNWQSFNSTAGSAEAHCPSSEYSLTDCTCLATNPSLRSCGGLHYAADNAGGATCRISSGASADDVIVGARCWQPPASLAATVRTETSLPTPAQVDAKAAAQCTMGSTVVGCTAATDGKKLPKSLKFEPGECVAVSDGSAVRSAARCASTAGAEVAFSINHWAYQSVSHMDKPTVAYCPDRFELSGCACFSEDAHMCAGAALTADGGCAATMFTGGNILQVLKHAVRGQNGVFAQARCMWSGPSERLLMLSATDGAAAQSTACRPLADADAQFERERASFVADLSKETNFNWSSQSAAWWMHQKKTYDFTKSINDARNSPNGQAVLQIMEGLGVHVPSGTPEDALPVEAPVDAIKAAVSQLPWTTIEDVKTRVKDMIESRGKGEGHDRKKSAASARDSDAPRDSPAAAVQGEVGVRTRDGDSHGGGAGAFFGGVAATVVLLMAVLAGFIFYQRHRERGLLNRRFLSHGEPASSASSFVPPAIVISPLQTAGTV